MCDSVSSNYFCLAKMVAVALVCLPVHAQTAAFACAASSPVVQPGETVRLLAWANLPGGGKPVYRWTVSSGEVRAAGNIFAWKFDANAAGANSADGELRAGSTVQARCLVEVQVAASRVAAIDSGLLGPGAAEAGGAGLYSYLLINVPSDPKNEEFLRAAVSGWIALNASVAELQHLLKPGEPIALGLPVLERTAARPDAEWVLRHYDFARARTMLEKAMPAGKPGVYIVSSLHPIAMSKPPYLIQDLSAATPALAAAWVEAFINQAAQEHTWNAANEASLVDQLRATVLSMAGEIPSIRPALLMKWIALL